MSFKSSRSFKIWSYVVSHSFLIIRSPLSEERDEKNISDCSVNVDVEFWEVGYMDMPSILDGIEIRVKNNNIPSKYKVYMNARQLGLFEIVSQGKMYYIVAAGCRVGTNTWLVDSRASDFRLEYQDVLATFQL